MLEGTREARSTTMNVVYVPRNIHEPVSLPPGRGMFIPYRVPITVGGIVRVKSMVRTARMVFALSLLKI